MSHLSQGRRSGSSRKVLRRFVKLAIPKRVVLEILRYREFQPHMRPLYLRLRTANALGISKLWTRKAPATARAFLFVCFGNIMRSPMCEALMARSIRNSQFHVRVMSAGLGATPGTPAHPWGVLAAQDFGIDLSPHRARRLTAEMLDQADVIFAMDYRNQVELLSRFPAARDKVFMLSAYAGGRYRSTEIQDPFFGDEDQTRKCYAVLEGCINNLIAGLGAGKNRDFGLRGTRMSVNLES